MTLPDAFWPLNSANYSGSPARVAANVGLDVAATALASADPAFDTDHRGQADMSTVFDGTNYLSAGDVYNIGTGDFTVSLWLKRGNNGGVSTGLVCHYAILPAAPLGWQIRLTSGTTPRLLLSDITGVALTVDCNPLTLGTWYHVCFTVNRDGNMTAYQDGVVVNATSIYAQQGALTVALNLVIGASSSLTNPFIGSLCRMRIYDTVALTAAEVAALYAEEAAAMAVAIAGEIIPMGVARGGDPNWLHIPSYLTWQGVWAAGTTYGENDAVLYQDGALLHAFASRAGTNLNHLPTDNLWWVRVQQEAWGKV